MRILILMSAIITMVSCNSSSNENPNQESDNVIIIATNNTEDSVFDVSTIETVGELLDTLESITSDTITE